MRANYEDIAHGITSTTVYLERFFENLLNGARHEFKNRYLHVDWSQDEVGQEATQEMPIATQETSKEISLTDKEIHETSKETRECIMVILRDEPMSTAVSVAKRLDLSPQGVRHHLDLLKKASRIHHEGPTKGGKWVVHE